MNELIHLNQRKNEGVIIKMKVLPKVFRKVYVEDRHGELSGWLTVRWQYLQKLGILSLISKESLQFEDIVFLTWNDEYIFLDVLKDLYVLYDIVDVPVGMHRFVALFSYNYFDRVQSYVKAPQGCNTRNKRIPLSKRKHIVTNFEGNYFFNHSMAGCITCRPQDYVEEKEVERYKCGRKKNRLKAGTVFSVYKLPDNVVDINDIWSYGMNMEHLGEFCIDDPFTYAKFNLHVRKVYIDHLDMLGNSSEKQFNKMVDIDQQARRYHFKVDTRILRDSQQAEIHEEFSRKVERWPGPTPPFHIIHGREETAWDRMFEGMKRCSF